MWLVNNNSVFRFRLELPDRQWMNWCFNQYRSIFFVAVFFPWLQFLIPTKISYHQQLHIPQFPNRFFDSSEGCVHGMLTPDKVRLSKPYGNSTETSEVRELVPTWMNLDSMLQIGWGGEQSAVIDVIFLGERVSETASVGNLICLIKCCIDHYRYSFCLIN